MEMIGMILEKKKTYTSKMSELSPYAFMENKLSQPHKYYQLET